MNSKICGNGNTLTNCIGQSEKCPTVRTTLGEEVSKGTRVKDNRFGTVRSAGHAAKEWQGHRRVAPVEPQPFARKMNELDSKVPPTAHLLHDFWPRTSSAHGRNGFFPAIYVNCWTDKRKGKVECKRQHLPHVTTLRMGDFSDCLSALLSSTPLPAELQMNFNFHFKALPGA